MEMYNRQCGGQGANRGAEARPLEPSVDRCGQDSGSRLTGGSEPLSGKVGTAVWLCGPTDCRHGVWVLS